MTLQDVIIKLDKLNKKFEKAICCLQESQGEGSSQNIQYQEDGINLGVPADVTTINFTGDISASLLAGVLTVDVTIPEIPDPVQVGTYAERIALITSDGLEFFQTDAQRDAPPGRYYYLSGHWNYERLSEERLQYHFDDFTVITAANTAAGSYVLTATGTGTPVSYGLRMSTSTSASGRVVLYSGANGLFSGWVDADLGAAYFKVNIIDLVQLSTVTEEFIFRAGFSDQTAASEPNIGAWIEYDRLNSVNWRFTQATGAGTRTETASAVPVTTGPHILEVFIPAGSGTTEFWVDNVMIGSTSNTRPSAIISPFLQLVKSAGTTPALVNIEYTKVWHYLTTTRS